MDFELTSAKFKNAAEEICTALNNAGAEASFEIFTNENDVGGEKEIVYLCAAVCVCCPGLSEDDALFLDLHTNLIDDDIDDKIKEFNAKGTAIAKRLSEAEDKAEMLKQIGKEMDDELEEQIKQLNKSVNGNLKVALTATGLLLFFAIVLILIERFL